MIMAKFEGFTSKSSLERRAASRYYLFCFVNVFLGSIVAGTALDQLHTFIHQSATEYVVLQDNLFQYTVQCLLFWLYDNICMSGFVCRLMLYK